MNKLPTLPFVGSMIPHHSGVPIFTFDNQYSFNNTMREKFGNFILSGFPGFGIGLHGLMYTIYDPREMAKVIRSEGAYPGGIVEKLWQWKRAMKESGSVLVTEKKEADATGETHDYGLFDNGDSWKRHRTFMQTGMLDPKAAKQFLPGIIEAATTASAMAPLHAEADMNQYLNYTAFDMFTSFMFGQQLETSASIVNPDPNVRAENSENERFVNAAIGVFGTTNKMNLFPLEFLMAKYIPWYKTTMFKKLQSDWDIVREVGLKKMYDFIERYDNDELDEMEKKSYLAGAIKRQREN